MFNRNATDLLNLFYYDYVLFIVIHNLFGIIIGLNLLCMSNIVFNICMCMHVCIGVLLMCMWRSKVLFYFFTGSPHYSVPLSRCESHSFG